LCCKVRTDLAQTIQDMLQRRDNAKRFHKSRSPSPTGLC
jgi:hypothetical protein